MASSVIFIDSPEKSHKNSLNKIKQLLCVSPDKVAFRIFASFVPPVSKKFRKVYVDLLGPILALLILAAFVNYGYSLKTLHSFRPPTEFIVAYCVAMPIVCYILCKFGDSTILFSEIVCLIGYALYGHILTLLLSFLCFEERSNFFFFLCLIFIDGLSTIRVILILITTLPLPIARLLICTLVSVLNLLFVIFLHFAYMHRTFTYQGH